MLDVEGVGKIHSFGRVLYLPHSARKTLTKRLPLCWERTDKPPAWSMCAWACFSAEKRCFKVFLVQTCSQSGESETNRFQAPNVVVHVFPRFQPRLRHRQWEVLNRWFVSKMFENDVIALIFKCWISSFTLFPQVEALSAPFGTEVIWSVRQHKDNVWRN